jgi:hypothetical protein
MGADTYLGPVQRALFCVSPVGVPKKNINLSFCGFGVGPKMFLWIVISSLGKNNKLRARSAEKTSGRGKR